MNIQPIKSEGVQAPAKPKAQPARTAKSAASTAPADNPKTARNERLMQALRNQPDVRPEEVERGKALAADPNYPGDEVLGKLAEMFVNDAARTK